MNSNDVDEPPVSGPERPEQLERALAWVEAGEVAQRTSLNLFGSRRAAFRSQLPMLVGMIAFSVFSLWLLKQPMEMRTSAM